MGREGDLGSKRSQFLPHGYAGGTPRVFDGRVSQAKTRPSKTLGVPPGPRGITRDPRGSTSRFLCSSHRLPASPGILSEPIPPHNPDSRPWSFAESAFGTWDRAPRGAW
jgi:hypothetical protein